MPLHSASTPLPPPQPAPKERKDARRMSAASPGRGLMMGSGHWAWSENHIWARVSETPHTERQGCQFFLYMTWALRVFSPGLWWAPPSFSLKAPQGLRNFYSNSEPSGQAELGLAPGPWQGTGEARRRPFPCWAPPACLCPSSEAEDRSSIPSLCWCFGWENKHPNKSDLLPGLLYATFTNYWKTKYRW